MNKFQSRIGTGGALGALFSTALGMVLLTTQLGLDLEQLSYDLPYLYKPIRVPQEACIVYLDEDSHKVLEQPFNQPWDRNFHAKLVRYLQEDHAAALVFDIVFSDLGPNPQADTNFVNALKDFGKAVMAVDYTKSGYGELVKARSFTPPHDIFLGEEGTNVALGIVEVPADEDLIVRKHFHGDTGEPIASMSWAVSELVGAEVTRSPENRFVPRWLNYYGPPTTIPNVSFHKVINREIPQGFFTGKVVFIGVRTFTKFSGERKDEYPHPFPRWRSDIKFIPGVDIHATSFLNLVRGESITRLPLLTETTVVLLAGLAFGYLFAQLRPVSAIAAAGVSAAAVVAVSYHLFDQRLLFYNWMVLVGAQIPVALVWSVAFNSVQLFVQKRLMENSVAMYVSPAVVKQIARNPEMLKPGAVKTELSVLFSDIANFTTMSEGMDPADLARLMNNYFEGAVNDCIQATQGTVVKFIGDAIFAIWNAPLTQSDHRERACRAALLLRDKVTDFDFKKPGLEGLEVRTRIGLHCGEASVGNFGSSKRVDYTAFGENINLSSRMEGLNKYMGTSILATGDILEPVQHLFTARHLGRFVLKGFNKNVEVYELIATADQSALSEPLRATFAAALKHFHQRDWDAAETTFRTLLQSHPNDGPSKFYLKHLADVRAEPPDADWQGEVELKEK